MLFPPSIKEAFKNQKQDFRVAYHQSLELMADKMKERGRARDSVSPLYYRRSPEGNLGMAQSKLIRTETLLGALDEENMTAEDMDAIIEEAIDAANYTIFIAALCLLVKEELQ